MTRGATWANGLASGALLLATIAVACEGDDDAPGVGTASGGNGGGAAASGAGAAGGTEGAFGTGCEGDGGELGSSGSGGEVADAGPPCSPEPAISEEQIARAVVALSSCISDDGYLRAQTYLRGKVGGYSYPGGACFTQCLAAVTSGCAGVRECLGLSDVELTDVCGTCRGNVAIVCGDTEVRWDCGKYGGSCSGGRCIPPGRTECDELTFEDECDAEGRPRHCDDTLHVGPACSAFGLECRKDGSSARCVGTGEACTAEEFAYFDVHYTGQACNGTRLNACVRGGLAELDCGLFGSDFTCQTSGTAFFCGTASECDPSTHEKTCDGANAVFCNAGKTARVDCTALGFTSCLDDPTFGCE
jgi:hypothetical protein